MRSTLLTLSHRKSLGDLATRVPVTRPMVRRFISGESFEEALPAIRPCTSREWGPRSTSWASR